MNSQILDLLNRWDTLTTGEEMHDAVMMVRYKVGEVSHLSKEEDMILTLLDKEATS